MSKKVHELAAEFPEDIEILRHLKATRGHFAVLADRYDEVNGAIQRIESELEAASDARLEDLRKERLCLLDQIGRMIRDAGAVGA
ncbi:YdcH family protein [Novosphingobium sp. ZW T3_23]|uniref:YdcH family protein n=1 Tax=Novosphingobium sp. ZW T3_23 TaxID=3378084 RepID=UPI0038555088